MPKRYVAYLLGLVLLVTAGLYGYYKWQKAQNKVNLWTLVPDDAVFVAETNRNDRFIRQLKKTEIYESLVRLPFFTGLQENLQLLDSASARRVTLREFLNQKKIVTSLHVTSKVDFNLVMYVPISTVAEHRYVRNVIENVAKSTLFSSEDQDYQSYAITAVRNVKANSTFYFFTYRNNIILSPEVTLLHQVIRKINRTYLQSPVQAYQNQNFFKKSTVYGTLFINYRHLPPFLALFLKPEVYPEVEFLASLCRSSLLGLQLDNQNFYLNGFSKPETLPGSLFKQFKRLQPQTTRMNHLIPERTALLVHFGEVQFDQWMNVSKKAPMPVAPEVALALDSLRANFKKELAINYLAAANEQTAPDKVVLAYTPQPNKVRTILQNINQRMGMAYTAKRAGRYQIQEVGVPELPEQLFGRGFSGFAQCFVAQADSFLLFAASEEALWGYLQHIRDNKVWAHSATYQTFKQLGLPQTSASLYVNTNQAWNMLNQNLVEDKKVGLLRHESLFKKFGQISLQFEQEAKQLITRFILQHQLQTNSPDQLKQVFKQEQEIAFAAPLILGPTYFPDTVTGRPPVLVQDSALVLHQVTADGKIAWSDSLDSKITSTIYPVQFGSNPQEKYVFSTQDRIYCLDQAGYDVENFPFNLLDTTVIQNMAVINRGAPQNLHFLVNDELGNVYLYDQQGNLLPGWEPKEIPGKLAMPPQYLQIKGREVFILVLENGYVYAIDLNGANYPGFPINLKGSVTSPLVVRPGSSFQNTNVAVLTQAGELITFNLAGQVEERTTFARPSRRTTFNLVPENSGKSFLVARQDRGRITLYDAQRKLIMEKNYVTSAPKLIQYFYFDPAHTIYAITERGPQKTYLYDIDIKLMGTGPLTNQWPVQLTFNALRQQYQIYVVHDNILQRFIFGNQP